MGCCESSAQREIYSNTGLSQKEERSQMDNLTLHLNELEKEEQKSPKVSRRKEIDKPLARLTKKRRERTQITKIINGKGEITTDTAEIQKNHKRIL